MRQIDNRFIQDLLHGRVGIFPVTSKKQPQQFQP